MWWHPHESLWSLGGKLATANAMDQDEALDALCGPRKFSLGLWWTANFLDVHHIFSALQLPMTAARSSFIWDLTASLADTCLLRLALRFCPACARESYHSILFQLRPLLECPIHHVPLRDACTQCGAAIDATKGVPWTCSHCNMALSNWAGLSWLTVFKAKRESTALDKVRDALVSNRTLEGQTSLVASVRANPEHYFAYLRGDLRTGALLLTGDPYVDDFDYWQAHPRACRLAQWYNEERSYLLTRVFARHATCVQQEQQVEFVPEAQGKSHYQCAVAAAILRSAALVGAPLDNPEVLPLTKTTEIGARTWLIPYLFCPSAQRYLAEEGAELVVRALARSALASSLAAFVDGQSEGSALWDPATGLKYPVKWRVHTRQGAATLTVHTEATAHHLARLERATRCRGPHLNRARANARRRPAREAVNL